MVYIETTVKFDDVEQAQDSLSGSEIRDGYILGYIRLAADQKDGCEVITIFECAKGSTPGRGERLVLLDT